MTVRQGQALINLPDPKHMRVRAKINESKIAFIRWAYPKAHGSRIDAFPGQPMMGTVEGLTPIPAPTGRSGQDVRVYYATVEIDSGGFDALRPGLSAEVTFLVDRPRKVTRVPLQAVRWVSARRPVRRGRREPRFRNVFYQVAMSELTVGQSDTSYMEVLSGVGPGDRVVARPEPLPALKAPGIRSVVPPARKPSPKTGRPTLPRG